jgi:hypothetical protein
VQQQARKKAADPPASPYQFEAVGTVNAVYSTVDVSATLTAGDSFEFTLLASR